MTLKLKCRRIRQLTYFATFNKYRFSAETQSSPSISPLASTSALAKDFSKLLYLKYGKSVVKRKK